MQKIHSLLDRSIEHKEFAMILRCVLSSLVLFLSIRPLVASHSTERDDEDRALKISKKELTKTKKDLRKVGERKKNLKISLATTFVQENGETENRQRFVNGSLSPRGISALRITKSQSARVIEEFSVEMEGLHISDSPFVPVVHGNIPKEKSSLNRSPRPSTLKKAKSFNGREEKEDEHSITAYKNRTAEKKKKSHDKKKKRHPKHDLDTKRKDKGETRKPRARSKSLMKSVENQRFKSNEEDEKNSSLVVVPNMLLSSHAGKVVRYVEKAQQAYQDAKYSSLLEEAQKEYKKKKVGIP